MLDSIRARLREHPWHTLELGLTALLWQASAGVFLLSLVQQYLPHHLEANPAFPGYALAAYASSRFLLQAPAGWLADRWGRRRTLTLGIALSFPSILLMLQVQDPMSFIAFSGLFGAGSAAIWPAMMAYVGDTHEASTRGRALNMLNIAQLVGLGIGTMAGVALTDYISYRAAFAACLLFSGLALFFAYRGASVSAPPVREEKVRGSYRGLVRELLSARMLLLAGIALLLSIATSVQAPAIGAYADEVLKTKLTVLGLMLIGPGLVGGFLAVRYGHVADRFGRQVPLIGGLAVAALSYFALSQTTHPLLAANLVVVAALAYAVSIPAWGASALDATEFGGRGVMLGVLATVQSLGASAGQAIGGVSNAAWGPLAPFKMGAVLLVLALLLAIMHMRHQQRAEQALAS